MTDSTDDVIAELTLEEKARMVMGSDFWHTTPVERLGVDRIRVADGPHGLRMQPDEADHVGHRREPAGDLLPDRQRPGVLVGPRPGRRGRCRPRRRRRACRASRSSSGPAST